MILKDKRIFVTGADGFIGSHLTEHLLGMGCHVRALTYYNSFNDWGWLEEQYGRSGLEIVPGDIRDANFVRSVMTDIDVVFHLAALIAIPYSYRSPESYVQTNVTGTLNVLQAALGTKVSRVIHTSTSEVYGTARSVPISESHPLQPQSPYSASKIGADSLATSFHLSFGLPVVTARPFNTYGPRQSARAVIPSIIGQAVTGRKSIRLGSAEPTRDFNFVEDTCRGLIALAECDGAIGKTVNIGSGKEISIGALVDLIREVSGGDFKVETEEQRIRPENSEVQRLLCDNSLINSLTGFLPQVSLREGLIRSVEWFKALPSYRRYKWDIYNV